MQVHATPTPGARVRKEDGALLKAEGEPVLRTAYWLRRQADGDVTLTDAMPDAADAADVPAAKAKK